MNKSSLIVVLALTFGCSVSTGSSGEPNGDSGSSSYQLSIGDECGAVETGLYGSHTYGLYNEAVDACLSLGGQCLPVNAQAAHDGPYVCMVAP